MAHSPYFLSPLADSPLLPFAPLSNPSLLTYLETLLAVTGSVHLGLRLLVNWPPLSQPFPQSLPPPNSQNPGYQAPHYDDFKTPASSVRNNYFCGKFASNLFSSSWWNDNKLSCIYSDLPFIRIHSPLPPLNANMYYPTVFPKEILQHLPFWIQIIFLVSDGKVWIQFFFLLHT